MHGPTRTCGPASSRGTVVGDGCERVRVAALLRPDGELSALELRLHEAHAARCAECRAYCAEIAGITACIRATPPQRLRRRIVVHRVPGRLSAAQVAGVIGLVIAAGLGESRDGATAAPQPAGAGAAGVGKTI